MKKTLMAIMCASLSSSVWALTASSEASLQHLQAEWARVRYEVPEAQRAVAFERLSLEAEEAVKAEPIAELYIWQGIIYSTWAGAQGGLKALSLVKQAKTSLEQALRLDAQALQGSAYTSLGALYYQVPGWPIAFGDDDEAEKLLRKALALNPQGIDPNYFYADFLLRQKRYGEAKTVLAVAAKAPARSGRETADAGRKAEIKALQAKLP